MTFSYKLLPGRTGAILAMLAMLLSLGCAPPDPLEPECRCGGDGGLCSASDDVGDIQGDAPPSDGTDEEMTGDPDVAQGLDGSDLPDGETPPDVVACAGEPDCPDTGVCEGMAAHCVNGAWVCDYGTLVLFEMGGETLCDLQDNDCDGAVDEALPRPDECTLDGVCAASIATCTDGEWDCGTEGLAGYEAEEVSFDGLDNDCDGGEPDEDLTHVCDAGERQCANETTPQICKSTQTGWENTNPCDASTPCMGAGECTPEAEFRVNEYVQSPQTSPAVATVDGNVVIAWESSGQDGDVEGIYYRAYDSVGGDLLPESRANLFTTGAQQHPAVAALGGSSFLVGWESNGQDGSLSSLFARAVHLGGGATAELGVTQATQDVQQGLTLASLLSGGVATAWSSPIAGQINAGLVTETGWPAAWEKVVATAESGKLVAPSIGAGAAGDVIVVWEHQVGIQKDVRGKLISNFVGEWMSGSTVDIGTDALVGETAPALVISSEYVYVVWVEQGAETEACLKRFGLALEAPSSKFCIAVDGEVLDVVAAPASDGLVVAWQEQSAAPHTLRMAHISSDLQQTDLADVAEGTMDPGGGLALADLGSGKYVVAWPIQAPGTGLDIWARFVQVD